MALNTIWGLPPALDMDYEKRVHCAIREVVNHGQVESAHDLGEGGLAVALAECCSGGIGADVTIACPGVNHDTGSRRANCASK